MRFTQTVEVPPAMLGPRVKANVYHLVVQKYEGACVNNVGYLYNIRDIAIASMKTLYCSPNVVATVVFSALVDKPSVADVSSAVVQKNIVHGVLMQTRFYKVFVPNIKNMKEGVSVNVRIVAVKYDKNQYNCIGELVK